MEEENISVNLETTFKNDLNYINNDVVAKQPNGNYTKWSRILKAVTVVNTTETQYIDYWVKQYKDRPELAKQIEDACNNKLHNDLISTNKMISLIKNSNDFKSEKVRAIEALRGKCNG